MFLRNLLLRTLLRNNKLHNFAPAVHYQYHHYGGYDNRDNGKYIPIALFSAVLVESTGTERKERQRPPKAEQEPETIVEPGLKRPDLPTYTADEVSKHDNLSSFWVTYKHGVYDVTSFLPSHPGGEQILNAAGLSIEPFWNVYGMHKTQEVFKLLESYRIGNLHDDDVVDHSDDELWVKEPFRDKRLIVKTAKPFNAEIPPKYQIEHFDTPNELFYVRQHMPVPELDAATHTLRVDVVDGTTTTTHLTLEELGQFETVTVRAALMCAGNRRSEMHKVKPVKGLSWQGGAISNAVWTGVRLRDVLLHCGVSEENTEGKHVILTGADIDATGESFSTSIPLAQALDGALLATHMNGAALPPDHGRPLRALVPGAPAVRSVKWLVSITVSEKESSSHWHQKDYRAFNPSKTWEDADFATAPPVYSLPVTSVICDPQDGDTVTVKDGFIEVKGYAYSGGGAKVMRVDLSVDGGRRWAEAALRCDPAPPRHHYSWALWNARIPVPRVDQVDIWVKATDSNFNTQPENFDDIWNIRGILGNAYHKIKVNLKH
ncbi:sulfite oxidase isoform X2 [Epargyreus clarus]|uniref:sulfite oxidase isoform X2 n=1 Tax=Epargyreus clarus TaxID=520877 RepID=UPI003C2EC7AF